MSPSGPIRVPDWATGILSYEADGTLISHDTGARGALGLGQRVEETSRGTVFTWHIGLRSDSGGVEQVRLATGADTTILGEWRKRPTRSVRYPACDNLRIQWGPILEPEAVWDAVAGRIAVLSGFDYAISVYDPGDAGQPAFDARSTPLS